MTVATTREQIYAAIFAKVSGAQFAAPVNNLASWAGSSRKYVDPAEIQTWPFLCQFEGMVEEYLQEGNRLPPIRTLGVRLFCWAWVNSGDTGELGSQYLTSMIEAVERALAPDVGGYGFPGLCTLGGLVQWARIEGTILKYPGDTEPQALVSIPVKVLWP